MGLGALSTDFMFIKEFVVRRKYISQSHPSE